MFVSAIEKVTQFTRPIHSIVRHYDGLIEPGASTMFFINEEGVAITCKHVAEILVQSETMNNAYIKFKAEKNALSKNSKFKKNLQALEKKYGYKKESVVQIKNNFINSVDTLSGFEIIPHTELDLAIVKLIGFKNTAYTSYAQFVTDQNKIKQGRQLCRLGYPFPEFNNFQIDSTTDDLSWTNTGMTGSPSFPIDGIITRFLASPNATVVGIELSTPGLRGQSGGPLFDSDGFVYGMQSATNHLHLGFDVKDKEVVSDGIRKKVSNYPFLHVGHCVHVNKIIEFLKANKIKYYTEEGVQQPS